MTAPGDGEAHGAGDLLTTGYEAETLDSILGRLLAHKVELLVDVRAIAQSRKPGFSKTLLSASLDARGIGYVHLRGLGTPKPGRIAARAGNRPELHRIFAQHMATEPAQQDLARLATLAAGRRCCLFCFERDHTACHRTIVANLLAERTGISVAHIQAPQRQKQEARLGSAQTRQGEPPWTGAT